MSSVASERMQASLIINNIAQDGAVSSDACFPGIVFTRWGSLNAVSGEVAHGGRFFTIWVSVSGASGESCRGRVILNALGRDSAPARQRLYGELRGHGWRVRIV
jgi:hypothetical protein